MNSLTPRELQQWRDEGRQFRLLDVREEREWLLVRLTGAEWRPLSRAQDWIEEVAGTAETDLVIYCHHGVRSAQVCGLLRSRGCTRTWNLRGGIERWAQEVEPSMIRY